MNNIIKKETLNAATYYLLAPGVDAGTVEIQVDMEESKVYVDATPELPKELADEAELGLKHVIAVDKKYDLGSAHVTVDNGIITIVFKTSKDRVVLVHPKKSE